MTPHWTDNLPIEQRKVASSPWIYPLWGQADVGHPKAYHGRVNDDNYQHTYHVDIHGPSVRDLGTQYYPATHEDHDNVAVGRLYYWIRQGMWDVVFVPNRGEV